MIRLLSESTQAAEFANGTSHAGGQASSCTQRQAYYLSKPKKQAQSGDDEKDEIKESNQMNML